MLISLVSLPLLKMNSLSDVQTTQYFFRFVETTNSRVKKQYDGFISFFLKKLHKIVTYCGTLFVGHCTVYLYDLFDRFFEFVRDLGINFNLLLALGIDSPNVNKSFKSLVEELQKRGATHFLDVGTCSIHMANNTFLKGIICLKDNVNVDQFAIDLHFFFKLKPCQTCLLSLDKVLVRIIKQYKNFKEYFLRTILMLPGFKGKMEPSNCTLPKN